MIANMLKVLSTGAVASTFIVSTTTFAKTESSVEKKGVVSQVLMNPEGDADGLLLDNGTQVKFPPHLSKELRAIVSAKDTVTVKGFEERGKVVRAESIANSKSGKSVVDTPPHEGGAGAPPPPPPPEGGPGKGPGPGGPGPGPRGPHAKRAGLSELTVKGKITNQLFGPRGEVNGVILSGGAIVHVGPKAVDDSKVSLEVGKQLQATGFGTKNEFGQSIEATELKN